METERLLLRPWKESDAESLFLYAKDERIAQPTGFPAHTSVENSREVIRTILSAPETYAICLKEDQRPIGSIGLTTGRQSSFDLPEKEGEIGYWIGVPFWGRGLIPEAVREMIRHGFEDLRLTTIWCGYFEGNEKSKRVQEKCGFVYHHTNRDILWKQTNDVRTEHVTRLTKEAWCMGKLTPEERIAKMETILNTANEKLDHLEAEIAALKEYQGEIRKLEAYYTSADWKKDFALDEAGKLPADLKRGVLSEDGVYLMLERNRELLSRINGEDEP